MGTPKKMVALSRSSVAMTSSGSKAGSRTWVAPSITPLNSRRLRAAEWYSGATCTIVSPTRMPRPMIMFWPTHSTRWWSKRAPFGRPVVPEV